MKVSISKKTILYAHPVFVVSSYDKNMKPNMMAVSWGGICSSEPPCLTVSIRKERYSYDCILNNEAFVVNIPSVENLKAADFSGVHSGRNTDKFEKLGLTAVKCDTVNAPYIKEFPMALICKLRTTVELGSHTQFIGEIIDVIVDDDKIGANKLPIIEKIMPFIYDSASRHYYSIGNRLDSAYTV